MIINTGMRTDIPAFYGEWFANRIKEGYVLVRNPYFPEQVTKYRLTPDVVSLLAFCTKNPEPMWNYMDVLKPFHQFWFVTITPYGTEIEPNVPEKAKVLEAFCRLARRVGPRAVSWRYDPVFISDTYSVEYHKAMFEKMAAKLEGYTTQAVISFIDLYAKTRKNFPEARAVTKEERLSLAISFAESGRRHKMTIRSCCEGVELEPYGIDVKGCMTKEILEDAVSEELRIPGGGRLREACKCVLGHDIGMYNTCAHFCRYCYANYDKNIVMENRASHDPHSPFLIGGFREWDEIREADQKSFLTGQMRLQF